MSVASRPLFAFDNTYARELAALGQAWKGAEVETPVLLALGADLAADLGLDTERLQSPEGVAVLSGSAVPEGAEPLAMAYAGHQFGGYSPLLGDGRALLLGEVIDRHGVRQDVHLKGSGKTPFARAGDGKAAIGPMLREFAISEAMHALGIRTARSLAVVATNEPVRRDTGLLPGAVLTRVAESHLRVGTFEFVAARQDEALLRKLTDYAIARHYPESAQADRPALDFYRRVVEAQADLVASWMLVGFIHGVMNTDNVTISGQTIDYGPCAFMDAYDLQTVFSSIDTGGRYAYGNQPNVAQWNLARLGEALLPLIGNSRGAVEELETVLHGFTVRYRDAFLAGMGRKLGLKPGAPDLDLLVDDLLLLLQNQKPDFTQFFRALSVSLACSDARVRALFPEVDGFDRWAGRWRETLAEQGVAPADAAAAMDRVNPVYIPRNHLVQHALDAATGGDLAPFAAMLSVLEDPFTERPGLEDWAAPRPDDNGTFRTFCGT